MKQRVLEKVTFEEISKAEGEKRGVTLRKKSRRGEGFLK